MKKIPVFTMCFSVAAIATGIAQDDIRTPALRSLVETERAFARTCMAKGVRASFLEFFADDGMAFRPEPFRYKDAVKNLPPQANPHAATLEWEPQVADVAASGDLGYTTGPSVYTDNSAQDKSRHYGQFFSIWKKQKDGRWKVAVDIGTETPSQSTPLGLPFNEPREGASVSATTRSSTGEQRTSVMSLERELGKSCVSDGIANAYLLRIEDDARLHRENELPIVGKEAIRSYLGKESLVPALSPIAGDVSAAGDLGYSYGSYQCKARDSSIVEKGYYLHVWKRNVSGEWKLVADITNPLHPEDIK